MKQIPLTHDKVALVDDEDFDKVTIYKWYALKIRHYWYACSNSNKKLIYMHRLILNAPQGYDVDHRNRNGLDNRKQNLRICTKIQNQYNSRPQAKRKTSHYKGLWFDKKNNKWVVRVKNKYIGSYSDEDEAARIYDKKAKKVYGEFAYMNF